MTYVAHSGALWVRLLIAGSALFAFSLGLASMVTQGSIPNESGRWLATVTSAGFGVASVAAFGYGLYVRKTDPQRRV